MHALMTADQWDKTEYNVDANTLQLIHKLQKLRIQRNSKEKRSFSTDYAEIWTFVCKIMDLDPYVESYTKINLKWNIDPCVKPNNRNV